MEPKEMKLLVEETHKALQALGKVSYNATEKEKASIRFRLSVDAMKDIKKGEAFTPENIRIIRPGSGFVSKIL